jgi:hypothetical protein
MSAFTIAGAIVCTPLAVLFGIAAFVPSSPPHPPYGSREAGCLMASIVLAFSAIYCIARLLGAA